MCETDYSGYPDCRDDTIKALQVAINLGMDARHVLHTPLMWLRQGRHLAPGRALGGPALVGLIRRRDPQLLPRRPHAPPRVGLSAAAPARPATCAAAGWERYRPRDQDGAHA